MCYCWFPKFNLDILNLVWALEMLVKYNISYYTSSGKKIVFANLPFILWIWNYYMHIPNCFLKLFCITIVLNIYFFPTQRFAGNWMLNFLFFLFFFTFHCRVDSHCLYYRYLLNSLEEFILLQVMFSRPIRWILALHGDVVVPFTFAGVLRQV